MIRRIVLDASIAIGWALPSQATPLTDRLLAQSESYEFRAPHIFHAEVLNAFAKAERARRISGEDVQLACDMILQMDLVVDSPPDKATLRELLGIARAERMSIYDVLYLGLAVALKAPLATRDEQLRQAAVRHGVAIESETAND